jgi:hypothetical protein
MVIKTGHYAILPELSVNDISYEQYAGSNKYIDQPEKFRK